MIDDPIVRANVVGTCLFVISATVAAVVFDGFAKSQGVAISLGLFAVGVVAFGWSYWKAVQRSRFDVMSVTELYFLVGPFIDKKVARLMNGLLTLQVVVAVVTALLRSSTPGTDGTSRPGSTLAFGVLVPVMGLGLNGVWSSHRARFPRRTSNEADRTEISPSE